MILAMEQIPWSNALVFIAGILALGMVVREAFKRL